MFPGVQGLGRAWLAPLLGSAVAIFTQPLGAEPAGRLAYARGVGAESCPSEEHFRQAVAARLGEDPFAETARRSFRVELVAQTGELVGHVSLSDENGVTQGVRTFEGAGDCGELVAAVALAVSLAINPDLAVSGPAPVEPGRAPSTPVVAPSRSLPPSPAQQPEHTEASVSDSVASPLELGGGLLGQAVAGTAPAPALGAVLAIRARVPLVSLSFEGRYDAPSSTPLEQGGRVKLSLLAALVAPCVHYRAFAGCALGLYGRVTASSENAPQDGSDSGPYAALGGRLAAEIPIVAPVSVAVRTDLLGPLTPVHLVRNGTRSIWDSPALSFALGVGMMARIP